MSVLLAAYDATCDGKGVSMKDLNVLTVTQKETGVFNINLVTQLGEYNNTDIAHWALFPPLELPQEELLDIITLLSRAIMHINPWPKIPAEMIGHLDWRVPHEFELL